MRVATFLVGGVDAVGHAHQFYQGSRLWVSSWASPTGGAFRLRTTLISICVSFSVLLFAACDGGDPPVSTPSTSAPMAPLTPGSPTASPTPPALPIVPPPTSGPPTGTCDQGWDTPKAGTPPFTEPLGIIRRTTGVKGPLVVVDMRHFIGPESPPSDKGYLLEIERWYIKLFAQDDIAFQGRFLVESRTFGRGLSAVAPYDTEGFESPDWVGFQFDSSHAAMKSYPGLPGQWSGTPYDFVRGGAGLKIPGLPDEVLGCLAGT